MAHRNDSMPTTESSARIESSPHMKERGKASGVKGWIAKTFKGDALDLPRTG